MSSGRLSCSVLRQASKTARLPPFGITQAHGANWISSSIWKCTAARSVPCITLSGGAPKLRRSSKLVSSQCRREIRKKCRLWLRGLTYQKKISARKSRLGMSLAQLQWLRPVGHLSRPRPSEPRCAGIPTGRTVYPATGTPGAIPSRYATPTQLTGTRPSLPDGVAANLVLRPTARLSDPARPLTREIDWSNLIGLI